MTGFVNPTAQATSQAPKKKAAAFINVNVVSSKDSESKKSLGKGIPLYADNPFHAALLEHMKAGGEVQLETAVHVVNEEVSFDF